MNPRSTNTLFITYLLYHFFDYVHISLFYIKILLIFYHSMTGITNYYSYLTYKILQLFYTFPVQYKLNYS